MFDRPGSGDKAILVCVGLGHAPEPDRVDEFTALARSAGALVLEVLVGTRKSAEPRYFVGTGKVDEIKARMPRSAPSALGGLIAILAIAILAGYSSGIGVREKNQSTAIMQQLGEQYQSALIDIQFARYEIAKQRLEWIISNDPTLPGAQEKLILSTP